MGDERGSESWRLAELHAYGLDAERETAYDALARAAAEVTRAPIGVITLLDDDEQWFKAVHGLPTRPDPVPWGLAVRLLDADDTVPMVVLDTHEDPDLARDPLLAQFPSVRFVAALPLRSAAGAVIGGLFVLDHQPREQLHPSSQELLGVVAGQVTATLDLHRRVVDAEERLAEVVAHESFLAEAQRVTGIGTYSWNFRAQSGHWSEQTCRVYGVETDGEALPPEEYLTLVHPDDREMVAAVIAAGEAVDTVHRVVRPTDGEVRSVHVLMWTLDDADGELVELRGTVQDVTEREQTLAALHDSEQRSRLTFDNAPTATVLISPEGQLVRVNRAASRLLRRSERALLTTHLDELAHPEDRDGVREDLRLSLTAGTVTKSDRRFRRPNGQVVETLFSTSLVRDPGGGVSALVGQLEDVTERRQAERERDEQAAMLRAVIDNDHSLICVKDLDGRYLLVNNAYLSAWDIDESMIIGETDEVLDPRLAAVWRANDRRALSGVFEFEEFADMPDGRHVFEAVKVPLRHPGGEIYAVCGISLDVTERRRATEAVEQARDAALAATAAKSSFLATMSHEIRTPMNAVIGMTGLLLDTELDPTQREFVETVRTSGDQLLAVINDILDFSKIEAGDLELEERPFEVRECIEGAVSLFAGISHGLDLVTDIAPEVPDVVVGDVTRLRQVISNLVGNAIKFTSEGDVLINAQVAAQRGEQLRLKISVTDTGIGIPADRLDRLFRSFSQVDASTTRVYGGTGLGLAISKALVEAMGGTLSVTSQEGVGSTFFFDVALRRGVDQRGRRSLAPHGRLRGQRALVVDDNGTNRRILRLQLESVGVVVSDTATPQEALDMVADGARFDLAVLDFHMPGMDGEDLAEALHELPGSADLPLMLLSSIGDTHVGPRRHHFSVVLPKPARRATLLDGVAALVAGATGSVSPSEAVAATRLRTTPSLPPQRPGDGPVRLSHHLEPLPQQRRHDDPAPEPAEGELRILLAEDNQVNQKVAQLLLKKLGHAVDTVANGREAVLAAAAQDYDVILMDVHMPVLDGLDATREIRAAEKKDHRPYVVALTASVTTEDRLACDRAGMDAYLSKPVRADHLGSLLSDIAGRTRAAGI